MNFKDYLEILDAEGLEESPLADGVLIQAMESKDEEEKINNIFLAIDLARLYKNETNMQKVIQEEFEKINGYRHSGFLNEYRMMKGR